MTKYTAAEMLGYCGLLRRTLFGLLRHQTAARPTISVTPDDSISINHVWDDQDTIALNFVIGDYHLRLVFGIEATITSAHLHLDHMGGVVDGYMKWLNYVGDPQAVIPRADGDLIAMKNDLYERRRVGIIPTYGESALVANLGGSEYHWCSIEYIPEMGRYRARIVSSDPEFSGYGGTPRTAVNDAALRLLTHEGNALIDRLDSAR